MLFHADQYGIRMLFHADTTRYRSSTSEKEVTVLEK